MGLLCRVIGHHRSRDKARQDPSGDIHSVCRFCGVPMHKHYVRGWEPVSDDRADEALDDSDAKLPPTP